MSEDNGFVSGMIDAKMTSDGDNQQVSMTLLDSGANIQIRWPLDMEEAQSDRLSSVVANLPGILNALYEGITEDPDGHFVAINLP